MIDIIVLMVYLVSLVFALDKKRALALRPEIVFHCLHDQLIPRE
jgi:hypothetical protein